MSWRHHLVSMKINLHKTSGDVIWCLEGIICKHIFLIRRTISVTFLPGWDFRHPAFAFHKFSTTGLQNHRPLREGGWGFIFSNWVVKNSCIKTLGKQCIHITYIIILSWYETKNLKKKKKSRQPLPIDCYTGLCNRGLTLNIGLKIKMNSKMKEI